MADDDQPEGTGGGPGVTLGQVQEIVNKALAKLSGGSRPGSGADEHQDVTGQVEAAVRKVHEGAERERQNAELAARVKALEDKPAPETKPKEYRSITRRVWGDDDD